ncbi:SDR family NAD(P)-dependent oxidoreductase [Dokdonella sp.]|uniref:SDR family NAD(P)-dependent oxidoreductase n=1 Tax=Dokdonella sp. TaxID=2291710 RepID=UPI0027BA1AEC|nr:SDR family NAD(P)-dependent oxidoreductase [Dokdonella sp.]
MTAIVVGASSGLGRALADELARRGQVLLLVASDARDLHALAADLQLRHEVEVATLALDLGREVDPGARILAALAALPPPTSLLLPVGLSRRDDDFTLSAGASGELLAINLHAPLAIIGALLPSLRETRGTIVSFGSIAAARGRGQNVAYAAAKRALESLHESLRQAHAPGALHVQLYRLGFLATNLTFGMALPWAATDPARIAPGLVRRLGKGSFARHLPRRYALVALLLRSLPWFAWRRLRR